MFYLMCLSWVIALFYYLIHNCLYIIYGCVTLLLFFLYFVRVVRTMSWFKQKSKDTNENHLSNIAKVTVSDDNITVIAADSVIEGSFFSGSIMEVYGNVHGDISLSSGHVYIHPGGIVKGNIRAESIVVGGSTEGECEAKSIIILETGYLKGVMRCTYISINSGGRFFGTSEMIDNNETDFRDSSSDDKTLCFKPQITI